VTGPANHEQFLTSCPDHPSRSRLSTLCNQVAQSKCCCPFRRGCQIGAQRSPQLSLQRSRGGTTTANRRGFGHACKCRCNCRKRTNGQGNKRSWGSVHIENEDIDRSGQDQADQLQSHNNGSWRRQLPSKLGREASFLRAPIVFCIRLKVW
jgi:hypothetical protein